MWTRVIMVLSAVLVGCALQRGSLAPPEDEAARTNLRNSGIKLYAARCASCHGDATQGAWAPRLTHKLLTPGLLADAVARRCRSVIGRPIGVDLTAPQALAIHMYIREW
ncbi:MAG: hypothetical protein H7338_13255 [Candidatus Sericytochromatia bacterium]|nr:hypothetical protein [Candidatus Sericytochromatia bacterium]